MIVGSVSENKNIENRVAITPDIVKKYKSIGLDVRIVKDYASHLGIKDKGTLINGKKDGEWIEYYDDSGDIFTKEFYKSGMLNGWSFLYGAKGLFELQESVLLGKWYFVNGVENGACSTYLENGDLFRSYEYRDGSIINFIEHNEPNNK